MIFESNEQLKSYLFERSSESLKDFNGRIMASPVPVIGVKIPVLKEIAKEAAREDLNAFLSVLSRDTFEEKILFGAAIGYAKISDGERVKLIAEYLTFADSWAAIDCAVSTYKFISKNKPLYLKEVERYLKSGGEFQVRFALVVLLGYFIDGERLSYIFKACDDADGSYYYVSMAVAWLISVAFVKYPIETEKYLYRTKIDDLTFNRAIAKINDSYRVDKQTKDRIKKLKRK